jgi:hypothetical protein
LTLAEITPGTLERASSTRATQEAQVIPIMGILAFSDFLGLDFSAITFLQGYQFLYYTTYLLPHSRLYRNQSKTIFISYLIIYYKVNQWLYVIYVIHLP